jgi:hypothetical protein
MEGGGKRSYSRNGKRKKAKLNPVQIQEYNFFVTQDGGEEEEMSANQPARAEKKCGRKRSTTFFFSE